MTRVDVTVEGVDRFVSTLSEASTAMGELAPEEAGKIAAAEARLKAPRRSRRLAASVGYDVASALVSVTATAPYAPPVHNGWIQGGRAHRAQPFIAAAIDTTEPRILAAYEADAQAVINTIQGA